MSPSGHFVGAWRTAAIGGSGARNYPHRPILSRVCCIASFGDTIRVSSVLGFKLEMKFGLFLETCCDESLPNRRCDLEELLLGKRRVPVSFKTDPAKTVADVGISGKRSESAACRG